MRGLLADVNVAGHLTYLQQRLAALSLWPLFEELNLELATFPVVGLPLDANDRTVWNFCQRERWVLFTENRNYDGADSLSATLEDSFQEGHLPVFTIANKRRFERDREYANQVAADIADVLFEIVLMNYQGPGRIYIPR